MWTIMPSTQLQSFQIDVGFPAVELWSMQIYAFGEEPPTLCLNCSENPIHSRVNIVN